MGYYTSYKLTIEEGSLDDIQKIEEEMELIDAGLGADLCPDIHEYDVECIGNAWEYGESCKWYDWRLTMVEYSKRHPNVVFKLHGEGEESGDIWNAYFKNGKHQVYRARIVFDEYDEELLE